MNLIQRILGARKPSPTGLDPRCPYCSVLIDPPPKRRRKCPSCRENIFIKRPPDGVRQLVTEARAKEIDGEWARRRRQKADVAWAELNKQALDGMKAHDWHAMSVAYFGMAVHLHGEGRDSYDVAVEGNKWRLTYLESSGYGEVRISPGGGGDCEPCAELANKRLGIEEARQSVPIPPKDCTYKFNDDAPNGHCRCRYMPVLDRDE